jgi:hypothetical protein
MTWKIGLNSLHTFNIRFASMRFLSFSFSTKDFLIRFDANISDSNPSSRYFSYIYSRPDSLYSLRNEKNEGTPAITEFTRICYMKQTKAGFSKHFLSTKRESIYIHV